MATRSSILALDREAWQAVVHRVRKNQTGLKQLSIRRDMSCFLKVSFI